MAASCGGGGQGRRTLSGPRAHGASNGFDPRAAQQNPLTPPPFLVEKWDGWDAQKQAGSPMKVLSNSDCEPLFLKELLAMADDEMKRSYEDMWLGYTHAQGCPVLRQEIADHMLADEGGVGGAHHCPLSVSPEHVNVVVPAEGIFLATMALLQPGDGVICAMPCYQSLHQLAETANCRVVPWLPRTRRWLRESCSARSEFVNGYHFDVEDLRQLVLQVRPKMVVINFPHNPTGAMLSPAQQQDLVAICRHANCYVLSDEMYRGLEHEGVPQLASVAGMYEKGISLGGVSKSLGLPGARIGWLATCDPVAARRIAELKDYTTICSSRPAEILATIAIRNRHELWERNRSIIHENKSNLRALVSRHPHVFDWLEPEGGTFAFIKLHLQASVTAATYARELMAKGNICVLPSDLFRNAGSDSLRITFGRRETSQLIDAWERLL
eukprot:Tamp_13318.p1 GENE.Tamp_13318~~Tamp_13318.p1  ORF type:complete len:456 (+),score=76.26 Tamp_13318:49-1368(+)